MTPHRFPIAPRVPSLIYLNGPAGSGKSALAEHLVSLDRGMTIYHHASPLWAMLDQIVGNNPETDAPYDFNDGELKKSPVLWSGKLSSYSSAPTYREALIALGYWTRNTFGPETLSRLAAESTRGLLVHYDSVIFPGIRTPEDLSHLVPAADPQESLLIRIFRPSHTWDNDLGSYLDPEKLDIPHVDLHNDGSLEDFFASALVALGAHE